MKEPTVSLNVIGQHGWPFIFNANRFFTDLKRDHILFSLATPSSDNDFLIFSRAVEDSINVFRGSDFALFTGLDYKPNMWHSICSTWDSTSGLVQLWFDGQPLIRKFISSGTRNIQGHAIIFLGQVKFYCKTLFLYSALYGCSILILFNCNLYRSRIPMVEALTLISLSLAWFLMSTCGTAPSPPVRSRSTWKIWTSLQGMCSTGGRWSSRLQTECW